MVERHALQRNLPALPLGWGQHLELWMEIKILSRKAAHAQLLMNNLTLGGKSIWDKSAQSEW